MSNGVIRIVEDMPTNGILASKVATLTEVWDRDSNEWYLYYTLGADLSAKLDRYAQAGHTLADPEPTAYFINHTPMYRRKIVKRDKGPSPDQALADADGENEFPRLAPNSPVCYCRPSDGQVWLVYARGEHMRTAVDELWKMGKALGRLELQCTDEEGQPLLYQGVRIYRRLIVAKEQGVNPADFQRAE